MTMTTIYKYPLKAADSQIIKMPKGAKILCVQVQHDIPCLWVEVNPASEAEDRVIETFGTGHPMPSDMGVMRDYIGTYQIQGGSLVFHVYEYK